MEKSRIFIGDIRKCTQRESVKTSFFDGKKVVKRSCWRSEIYKRHAILIEVDDNKFVDYSYFTSCENLKKIFVSIENNTPLDSIILENFGTHKGCLFFDSDSLMSIYEIEKMPAKVPNKRLVRAIKKANHI